MFIKNNKVIVIICILFYAEISRTDNTLLYWIPIWRIEFTDRGVKKKGKPEKYSDMHVLPKQISFETIPEQDPENWEICYVTPRICLFHERKYYYRSRFNRILVWQKDTKRQNPRKLWNSFCGGGEVTIEVVLLS